MAGTDLHFKGVFISPFLSLIAIGQFENIVGWSDWFAT
jgi:hypothetical protein